MPAECSVSRLLEQRRYDILKEYMKIIETFQKSLYDPSFYRSVATMSLKDTLRAYIVMVGVFTLLATVVFSLLLIPRVSRFLDEGARKVVDQYYPSDLEIHIEKGTASINALPPYFIPGKQSTLEMLSKDVPLENLLVIDTRSDFEKAQFEEHKTFALLTQHELITRGEHGQITIQSLSSFSNTTINTEILRHFIERARSWYPLVAVVGILALIAVLFVGYLLYLIPLLLFALIPFFIAWVKRAPLSYASAYKMSLYAVIPGLALKTLLNIGGYFFVPAYLSLLIFMLVIVINMQKRGVEETH